jgi:hypothetical protein
MASKRTYAAKIWATRIYAAGIWRGFGWDPPTNCAITAGITMPANTVSGDATITASSITGDVTMPANTVTTAIGIGCGYQN